MKFNAITVAPDQGKTPLGLIVLMHGWGANAEDLATLAPILDLPDYQFIFPDAPFDHGQVPGGRAWYALETMSYDGLSESRPGLQQWLGTLAEKTGFPPEQTILGGFSQGGAMTLDVGRELPFAGLMSLSGYLHFSPDARENYTTPVLMVHGRRDMVVPLGAARQARDYFQGLNAPVQYHELDMGHEIPPTVWQLIRSFVMENLPKPD
ncbi:MAG: alpha/beta hydrolase [Oscillatoriales cyanobacterium RM2_1_1]|nr:alpha/beta hydrolase [Oscillatoriales cyanobacterium SM2_3_0]NJO47775.1 alpha/beta hydrolase [Oscillatoriales cyanobacterium RM2_1_1]